MQMKTKDGIEVIITSKTKEHMQAHKVDMELVKEAISNVWTDNNGLIMKTINFEKIIGKSNGVRLSKNSTHHCQVQWAKRKGRGNWTRVTTEHEPSGCKTMAVIIKKINDGYELVTAYIGQITPREPTDTMVSRKQNMIDWGDLWCRFALVWNEEEFETAPVTMSLVEAWKDQKKGS